jgi:hypothetical protein
LAFNCQFPDCLGSKTLFKKHNASVRGSTQSFVAFHLLSPCDVEVQDVATGFHDKLKIEPIGLGHCSGPAAFLALRNLYQGKYLYAGLGSVHPATLELRCRFASATSLDAYPFEEKRQFAH